MSEDERNKEKVMKEEKTYLEPHEVLLLASYCDGEDSRCSERSPCDDCLMMCNVFQMQVPDGTKCLGELSDRRASS